MPCHPMPEKSVPRSAITVQAVQRCFEEDVQQCSLAEVQAVEAVQARQSLPPLIPRAKGGVGPGGTAGGSNASAWSLSGGVMQQYQCLSRW